MYRLLSSRRTARRPRLARTVAAAAALSLAVAAVVGCDRPANGWTASAAAAPADVDLSGLLPDGRQSTAQTRHDNLVFTPVAGWTKRKGEWRGEWTLEGPDFAKTRSQITVRSCVNLGEKGLAEMADLTDANGKTYIDWKEEAPRAEARHPAGYRTITTFTSVLAEGYGKGRRLYTLHVFLEADGLGMDVFYSGADRENFDRHRATFDKFIADARLLSAVQLADKFGEFGSLNQFDVNEAMDFLEWLLDVPLTDEQRVAGRDHLTAAWKRKDAEEAKGLIELYKARNQMNELKADKKELARVAARDEVVKQWRAEAGQGDRITKLMLDVYDRAHAAIAKGKDGEPALTRQSADATLEILHFMASKVAGFDAGPTAGQKAEFAQKLAGNYAAVPAEGKTELQQMPLYWAWLRAAWPELPAEDRAKLVEQWAAAEPVKPIVAQIREARAKAIANGDPKAFGEALLQLQRQQQTTAMISNMMAMQHRTNMMVINNIGSSNTRYEYKYVYRYR